MTYRNILTVITIIEKVKELIQLPNQKKDNTDIQIKPNACQIIDL
jgi:hypothetical protein